MGGVRHANLRICESELSKPEFPKLVGKLIYKPYGLISTSESHEALKEINTKNPKTPKR